MAATKTRSNATSQERELTGRTTRPKRTRDYRSGLLEDLKNPAEATHYLNAALRDSEEMFLVALRDVAEARQMAAVAKDAGVAREAIYRMLSPSGNPTYSNLISILRALGVEFGSVRPRVSSSAPPPPFIFRPATPKPQPVPRLSLDPSEQPLLPK